MANKTYSSNANESLIVDFGPHKVISYESLTGGMLNFNPIVIESKVLSKEVRYENYNIEAIEVRLPK